MNAMTLRLAVACMLFVSLSCCHILDSGKPARQVYLLRAPAPASAPGAIEPASTLIISVKAVPGLDTDRILVLGDDARLNPVSNAHWADNMPEVFTSITRRYLSDSHRFAAVRQGSIARPDEWLLELELQAFYGLKPAAGATTGVLLQMEGQLHCGSGQQVLNISQRSAVNGDTLSALVAAHQRVIDAAMPELSAGVLEFCSRPGAR